MVTKPVQRSEVAESFAPYEEIEEQVFEDVGPSGDAVLTDIEDDARMDYGSINATSQHSLHSSHDADSAVLDEPVHVDWVGTAINQTNLIAPKPRPGMVQRWVRYEDRSGVDKPNWASRLQHGWKPRPVDTVPDYERHYQVAHNSSGPDMIMVDGLVLCEMPAQLLARHAKWVAEQNQQMMRAVQTDHLKASRGVDHTGVERDEKIETTRGKGRVPRSM